MKGDLKRDEGIETALELAPHQRALFDEAAPSQREMRIMPQNAEPPVHTIVRMPRRCFDTVKDNHQNKETKTHE